MAKSLVQLRWEFLPGMVNGSAVGLAVLLGNASGCSDAHFRNRAINTAASEHRCQKVQIKNVVAEDRMRSEFAYWLDVCGRERLYRLDVTTGDRFVDQTAGTK